MIAFASVDRRLKRLEIWETSWSPQRFLFRTRTGPMSSVARQTGAVWMDRSRECQMRAPSKIKINVVRCRSHRSRSLACSRIAHALSAVPARTSECSAVCRFPLSISLAFPVYLARVAAQAHIRDAHIHTYQLVLPPFSESPLLCF